MIQSYYMCIILFNLHNGDIFFAILVLGGKNRLGTMSKTEALCAVNGNVTYGPILSTSLCGVAALLEQLPLQPMGDFCLLDIFPLS